MAGRGDLPLPHRPPSLAAAEKMNPVCSIIAALALLLPVGVQAQEAAVEEIEVCAGITRVLYRNQAFLVNQKGSPVRIAKVQVSHTPTETASVARMCREQMFRTLSTTEKERLRRMSRGIPGHYN